MLNPLHDSGFSSIGSKYGAKSPDNSLRFWVKGLARYWDKNPESFHIPFYKQMLEVYAIAEIDVNSAAPDIPGIEEKVTINKENRYVKEVSLRLEMKKSSLLDYIGTLQLEYMRQINFVMPPDCFSKLKIRIYYREGIMISPLEHQCDSWFTWPEWPEGPKDDSFLDDLILERNQTDNYILLSDGSGRFLNATSYHWNTSTINSIAWYIDEFVNRKEVRPKSPLHRMTMEGLINARNSNCCQLFIYAHQYYFNIALNEIKSFKRKVSHWMWFIFPQMMFRYPSEMSLIYSLDIHRMIKYRKNEYLMKNMGKMLNELLKDDCPDNASEIFGRDSGKFKNSLRFFINFHSCELKNECDFPFPEIDLLFEKVYLKFFKEKLKTDSRSHSRNLYYSRDFQHFSMLLKHYKRDYLRSWR
ncbi:MAG: DUF1810 family protein [Bacteroidia bacterium]